MFLLRVHHFRLDNANFGAMPCHFCWDHANIAILACLSVSLRPFDFYACSLSFLLRSYDFALLAACQFCLDLSIVVFHFRFDLVIWDLSNFGATAPHFRSTIAVFARIACHCRLDSRIFVTEARHFLRDLANIERVAFQSYLYLAIFSLGSCYFRLCASPW